jgi:predicted nucleic acid-binding protein
VSDALDTSVVLRLLTGEPPAQAELARRHVERSSEPLWLDALVVGESYFALRHHYGVPHREAVDALLALVGSDRTSASEQTRAALASARAGAGPGVMDRLFVAAARDVGRVLCTFDRQLARLDGARLLR